MKLFTYLRDLTTQLTLKLVDFLLPQRLHRRKHQKTGLEGSRLKQKPVRKHKTFASFLRDHDSGLLGRSALYRRRQTPQATRFGRRFNFWGIQKLVMDGSQ